MRIGKLIIKKAFIKNVCPENSNEGENKDTEKISLREILEVIM